MLTQGLSKETSPGTEKDRKENVFSAESRPWDKEGGGGGRSSRPLNKGVGAVSKKIFWGLSLV